MSDLDAEIESAVAFGEQGQWSKAEEHAMTAIKLNKKDERGYQHAAKAAAMLGDDERALKILTLGTARCPDSKLLATVYEKFKQNREANKINKMGKLQSAFDPSINKFTEKKEKTNQAQEASTSRETVTNLHKEGYEAYKSCHYQQAIDVFRKASHLYKEFPQELKTEKTSILGISLARIGLGTYHSLREVYETMIPIKSDSFPASYYILATVLHKLNRAKAALEIAEEGYKCSRNVDLDWETYYWPSIDEAIQESRRVVLKEKLGELCSTLRNIDPPNAVCRLPKCLSLSSHFMPSTSIYHSDPDFIGYILVKCEMKCTIAYHVNCWKHYKEKVSNVEKVSDKDMLGQLCPTEGCRTGKVKWRRSIITTVAVIDQNGELKTDVEGPPSKDTELQQPVQSVKKSKSVKKPGEKVFMKVAKEADSYFESDPEPDEMIERCVETLKRHSKGPANLPSCATISDNEEEDSEVEDNEGETYEMEKTIADAEQTIIQLQKVLQDERSKEQELNEKMKDNDVEKKLADAETFCQLLKAIDDSRNKEREITAQIKELTKEVCALRKENKQLSRKMEEESLKFEEEKESLKENAAKDIEIRQKQHAVLKNQLIKNNETQRNQIEELTKENASLKSSLDAANVQIPQLKNQLLGTQRRFIQELDTHFTNISKTFTDSSMRKISAMYSGIQHLNEQTTPSRKQMHACLEQWETTITKVNEIGGKFKKSLEGYEKTVKSGRIAEKKLTTLQVPSLPPPPEYPLRGVFEKNLKDSGALFKGKITSSCSSQTELRQVDIDKLLKQQESFDIGPSTSGLQNESSGRTGNGASTPRTGASTPTSICSVNSFISETMAQPASPVPAAAVATSSTGATGFTGTMPKTAGMGSSNDNSVFSRDKKKKKPAPTMANVVKGKSAPPDSNIPGPSVEEASSSSSTNTMRSSSKSVKKSNYQVLIDELVTNNYHVSETDVRSALQVVRNRNNNKLTGISKDQIARSVTEVLLEFLLQRPAPIASRSLDEDLARMLSQDPPEGDEEDCVICMDRKHAGDVYLMPCKHSFHPGCLRRWLMEDRCCPMCRQTVNLNGLGGSASVSRVDTPIEAFPAL